MIFSLSCEAGDHRLFIGFLGDKGAANEYTEANGGPTIIDVTSPIRLGIGCECEATRGEDCVMV